MRDGFIVHSGVKLPKADFVAKRSSDMEINLKLFYQYEQEIIAKLRDKPVSAAAFCKSKTITLKLVIANDKVP